MVQRLVDAVARPAAFADQLAAVSAQLAQLAEIARRHVAGPAQAELTDAGQPQTVGHVALAAFDLLDELRVQQQRLDAGVLEGLKRGLPENARALQRRGRHAMAPQTASGETFEAAALAKLELQAGKWRESTEAKARAELAAHVLPALGAADVASVGSAEAAECRRPIWASAPSVANRCPARIVLIVRHARALGHRAHGFEAEAVRELLPERKANGTQHRDSIPHGELASALAKVDPSEALPHVKASGPMFASRNGRPVSESSGRKAFRRYKLGGSPHGLRTSFRTWAAENAYSRELAELSLSHKFGSEVERAYQRSKLLEPRRPMMQDWGDHLEAA